MRPTTPHGYLMVPIRIVLALIIFSLPFHGFSQVLSRKISKARTGVKPASEEAAAAPKDATEEPEKEKQGNAELTLPDLGQGFTVIPTPTFTYSQVQQSGKAGFTAIVWANNIGTDSSLPKLGSKFLMPQTSLFGMKLEGGIRLTPNTSPVTLLLDGEVNLLVKKVSYYDAVEKTTTEFNPFVVHPRIGLSSSFFKDNFFFGAYWHFPCVLTENESFASFFKTGAKNVFVYPEINVGAIFDVSKGGNQLVKVEIDMLANNGDAQYFYPGGNVIPYLKIGFLTRL